MGGFSISHWAIIIFILIIFMGPKKLPELGKSIGMAIRDFKKGLNDEQAQQKKLPDDMDKKV